MRQIPLKGYGTFSRVFSHGKRFRASGLTAFVTFRPSQPHTESPNADLELRVGVTCRRGTKPAVMRNRIKRLLREGSRQVLLPRLQELQISEVVLVWHDIPSRPQQLQLSRVCEALKQLTISIESYHG